MTMQREELLRTPSVWQPREAGEAARLKARFGAEAVYAAGTTLLRTLWESGAAAMPAHLIDLGAIASLRGIEERDGELVIGSGTPLGECAASAAVARRAPLLAEAVREIAGYSVRNLATLGGNVVYRVGDSLPALLALDASLVWHDGDRETAERAEDWLAAPHGGSRVLTAIRIPAAQPPEEEAANPKKKRLSAYHKVGRRETFTPSLVTLAFDGAAFEDGTVETMRIAAGGGQTPPIRLRAAEAQLVGARPDAKLLSDVYREVYAVFAPKADPFASDAYRKTTLANLAIAQLWQWFGPTGGKG